MLAPESIEERRRSPDPGRLDGLSKSPRARPSATCRSPRSPHSSRRGGGPPADSTRPRRPQPRDLGRSGSGRVRPRPTRIRRRASPSSPDRAPLRPSSRRSPCRVPSRPARQRGTRGTTRRLVASPLRPRCGGRRRPPRRGRARRPPGCRRASGPPRVRRGCDHASGRRGSLSPRRIARARGGATASGGARRRSGGHKGFRNPGREAVARNRPPRMR